MSSPDKRQLELNGDAQHENSGSDNDDVPEGNGLDLNEANDGQANYDEALPNNNSSFLGNRTSFVGEYIQGTSMVEKPVDIADMEYRSQEDQDENEDEEAPVVVEYDSDDDKLKVDTRPS